MKLSDLITERMHENLNPRDIGTVERYSWLIEMIAIEYAGSEVKKLNIPAVSNPLSCVGCKYHNTTDDELCGTCGDTYKNKAT